MSTETLETTSPAPADQHSKGFKALLAQGAAVRLLTTDGVGYNGRICECCGSSIYPKEKRFKTPWVHYIPSAPEFDKYRFFDGTPAEARRLFDETMQDSDLLMACRSQNNGRPGPFELAYWVEYHRLGGSPSPEEAGKNQLDSWRTSLTTGYIPLGRDKAQVVFDPRPLGNHHC